jgi:hypothetical protein
MEGNWYLPLPPTNVYINWIRRRGGTTLLILFQALILKIAKWLLNEKSWLKHLKRVLCTSTPLLQTSSWAPKADSCYLKWEKYWENSGNIEQKKTFGNKLQNSNETWSGWVFVCISSSTVSLIFLGVQKKGRQTLLLLNKVFFFSGGSSFLHFCTPPPPRNLQLQNAKAQNW